MSRRANTSGAVLATLALMLGLAAPLAAQSSSLPTHLRAHTDAEIGPVTRFSTPTSANHECLVSVGYDNTSSAASVSLFWRVLVDGAEPLDQSRVESLSFQPVAVTAGAGITNRLFVAGWSDRDELVLEQWTVPSPTAVASAMNPSTGVVSTTAIIPRVTRSEIARLAQPGPVWSMAVNPHGGAEGRLLLLAYSHPASSVAEVWEFDIATRTLLDGAGAGEPSPLWTSQVYPALQGRSNIWAANIPSLGFVVLVTDDKAFHVHQRARRYAFFIDADADGDYDAHGDLSRTEFLQAHPHATWAPYADG